MLKKDYLLFQISELEELNPDPEEEETLKIKRERLRHIQLIQELSSGLRISLDSAKDNLTQALSLLSKLTPFEPSFKERQHLLQDLYYEISELERDLKVLEEISWRIPLNLNKLNPVLQNMKDLRKNMVKMHRG